MSKSDTEIERWTAKRKTQVVLDVLKGKTTFAVMRPVKIRRYARALGLLANTHALDDQLTRPSQNRGNDHLPRFSALRGKQPNECGTVHYNGPPENSTERLLSRFVPQPTLRDQCAWPTTSQSQKMQRLLTHSPGPRFRRRFIDSICSKRSSTDNDIEQQDGRWNSRHHNCANNNQQKANRNRIRQDFGLPWFWSSRNTRNGCCFRARPAACIGGHGKGHDITDCWTTASIAEGLYVCEHVPSSLERGDKAVSLAIIPGRDFPFLSHWPVSQEFALKPSGG